VIYEVINEYAKRNKQFQYCCCIYATAPFVTAAMLTECFQKLITSGADSLIPVVPFSYPILRSLKIDQGLLKMNWPEYANSRSQDLPTAFHDIGQFYFLEVARFLRNKKIFSENTIPFEMNELYVQDIDNESDWKLAELKFKILNS
jgi:N-acylneuraminate cytidylyltransferase